jgi:hypothetical protein
VRQVESRESAESADADSETYHLGEKRYPTPYREKIAIPITVEAFPLKALITSIDTFPRS